MLYDPKAKRTVGIPQPPIYKHLMRGRDDKPVSRGTPGLIGGQGGQSVQRTTPESTRGDACGSEELTNHSSSTTEA